MLLTRRIPLFEDDPGDWHDFIYRSSKGSIKAVDVLNYAAMAYMVDLTGDPESPSTLHLDNYKAKVCEVLSPTPVVLSLQDFHDIALHSNWIPEAFRISESPYNTAEKYQGLWGCRAVNWNALVNDAMLLCLKSWSAEHFIVCTDEYALDYDARVAVAGMLYLLLTWPKT